MFFDVSECGREESFFVEKEDVELAKLSLPSAAPSGQPCFVAKTYTCTCSCDWGPEMLTLLFQNTSPGQSKVLFFRLSPPSEGWTIEKLPVFFHTHTRASSQPRSCFVCVAKIYACSTCICSWIQVLEKLGFFLASFCHCSRGKRIAPPAWEGWCVCEMTGWGWQNPSLDLLSSCMCGVCIWWESYVALSV